LTTLALLQLLRSSKETVIVKIQDKKADEMRLLNVRRLFCEDGKSHRMTVHRNGSLVETTIGLGTTQSEIECEAPIGLREISSLAFLRARNSCRGRRPAESDVKLELCLAVANHRLNKILSRGDEQVEAAEDFDELAKLVFGSQKVLPIRLLRRLDAAFCYVNLMSARADSGERFGHFTMDAIDCLYSLGLGDIDLSANSILHGAVAHAEVLQTPNRDNVQVRPRVELAHAIAHLVASAAEFSGAESDGDGWEERPNSLLAKSGLIEGHFRASSGDFRPIGDGRFE
jgi:hypothetical protein